MSGWVAIHRDILNSDLWLSEKFTRGQAWIDLIMLANHKDGFFRKRGVRIDVKRGQVGYSELALSDRWSWSRGKVNRYLNELESDGNIIQQKAHLTTLITITKYDAYQSKQDNRRTTSDTTDGQQTDINNNDNKVNNGNKKQREPKKERIYPSELNKTAWQEYIDYRKEAKIRKLTKSGEDKQIEKIIRYGGYDIQQQCINESIANGWQGIFPPSKKLNGGKSKAGNFLDRCVDGWNDT